MSRIATTKMSGLLLGRLGPRFVSSAKPSSLLEFRYFSTLDSGSNTRKKRRESGETTKRCGCWWWEGHSELLGGGPASAYQGGWLPVEGELFQGTSNLPSGKLYSYWKFIKKTSIDCIFGNKIISICALLLTQRSIFRHIFLYKKSV